MTGRCEVRGFLSRAEGCWDLGVFLAAVLPNGPIDFKNNFAGAPGYSASFLGAAGNFAYGAVASGIGYSQPFAEFGAGVYAGAAGKANPNNPWGEDNSAAQNLPAGYATWDAFFSDLGSE
jgi:hypothetical protein